MAAALRTAEQLLATLQALEQESTPGSHVVGSAAASAPAVQPDGMPPAAIAKTPAARVQEKQELALGVLSQAAQRELSSFLSRRLVPAPDSTSSLGSKPLAEEDSRPSGVQGSDRGGARNGESVVELLTGPALGVLLACAYPERIAQRQNRGSRQGFCVLLLRMIVYSLSCAVVLQGKPR